MTTKRENLVVSTIQHRRERWVWLVVRVIDSECMKRLQRYTEDNMMDIWSKLVWYICTVIIIYFSFIDDSLIHFLVPILAEICPNPDNLYSPCFIDFSFR